MLLTTRTTVTLCHRIVAACLAVAVMVQPLTVWASTVSCSPVGMSSDASGPLAHTVCNCCCGQNDKAESGCCCALPTSSAHQDDEAGPSSDVGWRSVSTVEVLLWRASCRCSIADLPINRYDQRRDDGRCSETVSGSLSRVLLPAHSVRIQSCRIGPDADFGGCASIQCMHCVWRI